MILENALHVMVSAEQAWQLLGEEFGEIAEWATPITESSLDGPLETGATRRCRIQGFGPFQASVFTEELVLFDRAARSFRYEARSGLPPLMTHAQNHWTIHETGPESCRITSTAELHVAWWAWPILPLLRFQITRDSKGFMESLRYRLEEGVPLAATMPV